MKKTLIVFVATLVFSTFAEDDPDFVYVDVPYTCVVDKSQKAILVTFSDYSARSFYYCNFQNSHMKVTDAMSEFGDAYDEVFDTMTREGIAEKFSSENMVRWNQAVQSILYVGQALQQYRDNEKLNELGRKIEDNQISESEYNTQVSTIKSRIDQIKTDYDTIKSGIEQEFTDSKISIQQQLTAANEAQTMMMQQLKNAISQQQETSQIIQKLKDVQNAAIDIAALKKSMNSLQSELAKKTIPIIGVGDMSRSEFSQNITNITSWLGSHSRLNGHFTPPVNPVTSNRYNAASANLATWMKDLGVMGYWGIELKEAYFGGTGDTGNIYNFHNDNKRGFCEMRNDDGSITNILAGFSAPTNWIDNVTITYSNGVYSAVATNAVAASSGPFSIRNGQLVDRYYNVGGKTYTASAHSVINGGVLCLRIAQSSASAVYTTYSTIAAMQSAQNDLTAYIIPLYEFNNDGSVKTDLRTSLNAVMMEY